MTCARCDGEQWREGRPAALYTTQRGPAYHLDYTWCSWGVLCSWSVLCSCTNSVMSIILHSGTARNHAANWRNSFPVLTAYRPGSMYWLRYTVMVARSRDANPTSFARFSTTHVILLAGGDTGNRGCAGAVLLGPPCPGIWADPGTCCLRNASRRDMVGVNRRRGDPSCCGWCPPSSSASRPSDSKSASTAAMFCCRQARHRLERASFPGSTIVKMLLRWSGAG